MLAVSKAPGRGKSLIPIRSAAMTCEHRQHETLTSHSTLLFILPPSEGQR